ncbi:MAG: hypothetical protein COT81_03910 [Candidatus Buchananbacteria bacterium CG10_big_fil_rev_8_21_14_0_10_42_9]|uniref:Inositol monophosphatase n=1 Tax=Candidatus Buchananbacteria bacterium CG10_big_fil_rev_8_21_14_0_10_42_9 TaxID=1974526 RepID=A0A2H0W0T7_9BACT|nr:MAG: hypothetical protein COT81_03910 [Candidatus Buchananbacteria bacterium CG10_big_fil_rev_8_21_14_0_10_42_9]
MQKVYHEVLKFITVEGQRIVRHGGSIKDVGVTKEFLTQEDVRIERGLKKIIKSHDPRHEFYAEEENGTFNHVNDYWVADPISGTRLFIRGLHHYAIAVAHISQGKVQFSAIYDPSVDELFTAFRGRGAFLNKKRIHISKARKSKDTSVIYHLSWHWPDFASGRKMFEELSKFRLFRNANSIAVNYCHVACGRYEGVVALSKDAFPEFAASLIVQEAGGVFVNKNGQPTINYSDRVFMGGNRAIVNELSKIVKKVNL